MRTDISLPFADGEYLFRLPNAQIIELERKCDAGLGRIYGRTSAGRYGLSAGDILPEQADYRFGELLEVVRQGLIGGGQGVVDGAEVKVSPPRANQLVTAYLADGATRQPVRETWALAYTILSALVEGYEPPKG